MDEIAGVLTDFESSLILSWLTRYLLAPKCQIKRLVNLTSQIKTNSTYCLKISYKAESLDSWTSGQLVHGLNS